ncbi:MAG: hypothetical protein AAFV37_07350 [Pseudomonadota bacterium]
MRSLCIALAVLCLATTQALAAPAASKSHFTIENLSNAMIKIQIFTADDYFGMSTPDQFGLAALSQRTFNCPSRDRYACRIEVTAKQVPICVDLLPANEHAVLRLSNNATLTVVQTRKGGFVCEISQGADS